jgi:hypothetical protein
MVTLEPIRFAEMATRTGRPGVTYIDPDTGLQYVWDYESTKFIPLGGRVRHRTGAAISGTATITAAQLATGSLVFSGGAGSQTLPTAALLGALIGAKQGTEFDFTVDNSAGSGTCTLVVSASILVPATVVVTGGATLTVAGQATGLALFRIVFSSATAAVVFRIG